MYKVATFLLNHFWGHPADMADGLGVLLLTWNQAFYRYGGFDFDRLEACITKHLALIDEFRKRDLASLEISDEINITGLFRDFLDALGVYKRGLRTRKSPVAVAKALHLLAPNFFPLWDDKIARAYDCYYHTNSSAQYLRFCKIAKSQLQIIKTYNIQSNKTLIKLLDEFNYSKYTKGWIWGPKQWATKKTGRKQQPRET